MFISKQIFSWLLLGTLQKKLCNAWQNSRMTEHERYAHDLRENQDRLRRRASSHTTRSADGLGGNGDHDRVQRVIYPRKK